MIIITDRAKEVGQWIEGNCSEPSTYRITKAWKNDIFVVARDWPDEMTIILTPVDQMLFELRWAGCFIKLDLNGKWYDDTKINRYFLEDFPASLLDY